MCVFATQQIPAKKGFYCSARSDSVTSWFPLKFVLAIQWTEACYLSEHDLDSRMNNLSS